MTPWLRVWLLALAVGIAPLGAVAACAALGPADQAAAADTASEIANCQAVEMHCLADAGPDAGAHCYGLYDACMRDGGLR